MAKRVFDKVEENMSNSEPVRIMRSEVPKKADKKTKIIIISVVGVLLAVAVTCFAFAGKEKHEDAQIVTMWDEVKEIATPSDAKPVASQTSTVDTGSNVNQEVEEPEDEESIVSHEAYSENPMARVIDWEALKKINPDVTGWIYIPRIGLDYPILQEQEYGKSFYLTHNIYKTAQKSGAIFTPKEQADTDRDMHMLIYGHHMKNGSMFGILTKYKDEEFYKKHPYIYIYYPDRTEKWGIWTMEHVKDGDDVYLIPYTYDTVEYDELLRYLEEKSDYKTDYFGVDNKTRTVTLSTCDSSGDRSGLGRFIVNAVLVETGSPGAGTKQSIPDVSVPEKSNQNVEISEDDEYAGYTINNADTINEDVVNDGEVVQFESGE